MKKSKQLLLIMAFCVFTTNCKENSTENLKNNQEREKSIANKTNNSQVKIGTQIWMTANLNVDPNRQDKNL